MPILRLLRRSLLLLTCVLPLAGCGTGQQNAIEGAVPTIDSLTIAPNVSNAGRMVHAFCQTPVMPFI